MAKIVSIDSSYYIAQLKELNVQADGIRIKMFDATYKMSYADKYVMRDLLTDIKAVTNLLERALEDEKPKPNFIIQIFNKRK